MEVYAVMKQYWHDIDGTYETLIDLYKDKSRAMTEASLLNDEEGYSNAGSSVEFSVDTVVVK